MKKVTGQSDRSDYMVLSSKDMIYIYEIGGASNPAQIDISGSENHQVLGDRILVYYSDFLDVYDLSGKQLNGNNTIYIKDSTIKPHQNRIYVFGETKDVDIFDWNGHTVNDIDTNPWVNADVVGNHIFIAYTNDVVTYDLDGSNEIKTNVDVDQPEFLEDKFINLYGSGGTIYDWNGEKWEPAYFDSPYSDSLVLVDDYIIGVSSNKLNLFDLNGASVGDELDLYTEFKKENVLFR
ncbi:MAG: hypothetical protein Q7J07_10825 [Pelolinea sp.]|nr:hypothetical protein [Pelolinea sp.]